MRQYRVVGTCCTAGAGQHHIRTVEHAACAGDAVATVESRIGITECGWSEPVVIVNLDLLARVIDAQVAADMVVERGVYE